MEYKKLVFDTQGQLAIITLSRLEMENAVDAEMAQELAEVCLRINQDPDIIVTVVTGSGGEAFSVCSGCLSVEDDQSSPSARLTVQYPSVAIASLNCPSIAAVNGDAIGQGLEMALACDMRVARKGAKFGFPGIAVGLIPCDGGTQRLPRLINKGKAMEMLLAGEEVDSDEACRIGLVNKVVPADKLMPTVMEMARSMCSKAPLALKYAKEAINKGMDLTLEQGLRLEADLYFLIQMTRDRTEGVRAFLEKRRPQFKGS